MSDPLRCPKCGSADYHEVVPGSSAHVHSKCCAVRECDFAWLRRSHAELLAACEAARNWYGLDGDGISEPVRSQLIKAIANARPEKAP